MYDSILIKITMFGEFSISTESSCLTDRALQSKKIWTLIKYLITYREREISQNELIELLWPEDEILNPVNALKTLMHRARTALKNLYNEREFILFQNGSYAWNNELSCYIDSEEFERLAKNASLTSISIDTRIELYKNAIELYKGDFLPKLSNEPWVIPLHIYYHTQYLKIVKELITLLMKNKDYNQIIDLCNHAIRIDPYEESLHYNLIVAYIEMGNSNKALEQYQQLKTLLYKTYGTNPTKEFIDLYHKIMKRSVELKVDNLVSIQKQIEEAGTKKEANEAFICDFPFFEELCHIEARGAIRSGNTSFLSLITMTNYDNKHTELTRLSKAVECLEQCLKSSLRSGDVITRYSSTQYILLLSNTSYDNSHLISKRLISRFKKENPRLQVLLHYEVLPLVTFNQTKHPYSP